MKNKVRFSVIIPLYNKEVSIASTIQSVLNQTYDDFELIVVNDGSTDKSREVIADIADSRIRIIDKENGGVSGARNRGIREANNEWLTFLDGDDRWDANYLSLMNGLIEVYPDYKFFASSISYVEADLGRKGKTYVIDDFFKLNHRSTFIHTDAIVIHRSCFGKAGMFDERFSKGEDIDMWRRIARYYQIIKSDCVTAWYRLEAENRACKKRFSIEDTSLWYIDWSDRSLTPTEVIYLKKQIVRAVLYMYYHRNFVVGTKLLSKHIKEIFKNKK